jgi:predicted TIM-barrel fold metal-dependent hydrolase
VIKHMGADRVLFGSDWPHMEGLEHPQNIFDELDDVDSDHEKLILHDNAAALNRRQAI